MPAEWMLRKEATAAAVAAAAAAVGTEESGQLKKASESVGQCKRVQLTKVDFETARTGSERTGPRTAGKAEEHCRTELCCRKAQHCKREEYCRWRGEEMDLMELARGCHE